MIALAAVAALLVPGVARAAQPGLDTDLTWGISSADQDRTADAMHQAGARWTRLTIQWNAWETAPGQYAPWEVARTDRAVQLCRQHGIHVLIDVYNAPGWAAGTDGSGEGNVPKDDADFANFMRYVASRYRGQAEAYELWNEPDLQRFWAGGPDPAAYTALLKAGYSGVKAADPSALVVSGGLSWDYESTSGFLGKMYAAGAKDAFDVLGIHAYPVRSLNDNLGIWQASYRDARQVELAKGDSKPVWITEFGINTSTDPTAWQPGVSEQKQADLVSRAFALTAQDPWLGVLFYYNFRNDWWSHDDPGNMEAQFGLMTTDFTPKPAFYAFQAAAGAAPSPAPPPPPPAADAPPKVALTSPVAGAQFSGSLTLTATATDDKGVAKVRFVVDGTVVATDGSAPYRVSWRPQKSRGGSYTITAVAVDTAGQSTTSAPVQVSEVARTHTQTTGRKVQAERLRPARRHKAAPHRARRHRLRRA